MSLLGSFYKQPVEVEIYSIQYKADLAATDELTAAWHLFTSEVAEAWDGVTKTDPYTVLLTDSEKTIVTTASVTAPTGAPEGFRFYVANASQSAGIFVNGIAIPARGASVLTYKSGAWVQEAKSELVLVTSLNDQRVRIRVFNGSLYEVYKAQITVTTAEGRVLQDEFLVTIEES